MPDLPTPVRLLTNVRSPSPRRVHIFLAEKGVTLPTEDVDIMTGAHFKSDYIARVGVPVVPVLELTDGTMLTETVAISRYLEALYPDPNLMGTNPLEGATIEMWHRRCEFRLLLPIAQVLRHTNPAMEILERPCPPWGEANRERVIEGLEYLDKRLESEPYVAGERFTVADIVAIVAIDFMRTIRQRIPDNCPALADWAERMHARPSLTV